MERNLTVDIAKGIGIVVVVIGHMNHFFDYEDLVPTIIYSFHMPLFIILSGYVFNYHEGIAAKEYCYRRFGQIIKPYFIFAAITLLYEYARNGGVNGDEVYGVFVGNGVDGHLNFNIALWFLPMLFFCNIIFWGIVKLSKHTLRLPISYMIMIISSTILTVIGYNMIIRQKRLPWGLETAMFSQIFMLIGYVFKTIKNIYGIDTKLRKIFICIFPVMAALWGGG